MTDMIQIWKDGSFSEETWAAGESAAQAGDAIITLADWQTGEWTNHDGRLALSVSSDDDIDAVAKELEYFDMVIVNFPSFANGTAFSIARLIRDKYGFEREIRASGAYIIDQMPMLMRCGVTSFEVSSDAVRAGLKRGFWPDMPRYYQHALDGERIINTDKIRPWLSMIAVSGDEVERSAA